MMFKYLLLKDIYHLSDVDVVERSLSDMAFKYFLGLAPEDSVIEASSLTNSENYVSKMNTCWIY